MTKTRRIFWQVVSVVASVAALAMAAGAPSDFPGL